VEREKEKNIFGVEERNDCGEGAKKKGAKNKQKKKVKEKTKERKKKERKIKIQSRNKQE
jgi:hypothetical protein